MPRNDVIGILFAYVHEERVRELTQNRVMAFRAPMAGATAWWTSPCPTW